eukprot:1457021-Pleurochrysis_carterae.AAC.1
MKLGAKVMEAGPVAARNGVRRGVAVATQVCDACMLGHSVVRGIIEQRTKYAVQTVAARAFANEHSGGGKRVAHEHYVPRADEVCGEGYCVESRCQQLQGGDV